MKHDFFTHLPSEIVTNILLRLSVRSIAISKCVCKPWLDLLDADDFVNFHLSRSVPALAVLIPKGGSNRCQLFELGDELDLDRLHDPLTKFDFPHGATIEGSANGLLILQNDELNDALYVCNPITREFCEVPSPPEGFGFGYGYGHVYGFGASTITGQHKVVCFNHKSHVDPGSGCHVYTLGTGSWRRVEGSPIVYAYGDFGAFVNGNLHWIVASESRDKGCISCFDVETECFSAFSPPIERCSLSLSLFTLRDCLCFCDESAADEIVIWLVKEYQVERCWSKEYVIAQHPYHGVNGCFEFLRPIKVFQNGDMLMLWDEQFLCYYFNKTRTYQEIGLFGGVRDDDDYCYFNLMLLTPTFLSLKSCGMENVISF
ncbi:F-box protein At3g07870-like [Salvia miltiorrhiza]|uniref:F-box protein At3g07870-like n=1 Tax=Salvia miltiorrhiza TaxID=226208 RepID=UPI0025AC4ACB|nr:F-box protein At3g07870-like [Salvia miltiorrhiza]